MPEDRTFDLELAQHGLEHTRQLCWRHTFAVIEQSLSWMSHLPFSLARRDTLERLTAARDEHMAQPCDQRRRVSTGFFGEGAALVSKSIADGGMHPRVAERVRAIALIPLAEHRGEQPRSVLHRQSLHSRRAGRTWHASTLRLEQNIQEYRKLSSVEDLALFRLEWGRARRLLQYSEKHEFVYRRGLSHVKTYELCYRTIVSVPCFDNDVKVGRADRGLTAMDGVVSSSGRLQFELLSAFLKPGVFFIIVPAEHVAFRLFHVVCVISPYHKWVKSARREPLGFFRADVVDLFPVVAVGDALPDSLDVSPSIKHVAVVDLLKPAEWAVVRTTLRVWTVGPVAREGFLHLQDAANIDVIMMGADLGAKTTPLLLIFENLRRKGWGPQSEARPPCVFWPLP